MLALDSTLAHPSLSPSLPRSLLPFLLRPTGGLAGPSAHSTDSFPASFLPSGHGGRRKGGRAGRRDGGRGGGEEERTWKAAIEPLPKVKKERGREGHSGGGRAGGRERGKGKEGRGENERKQERFQGE